MISIRDRGSRGVSRAGWLDSKHTFSFGGFYDPAHMGFRSLRVINDDRVIPGAGFGTHPHRDMEIITYVLDGALEHRDSMGNGSIICPGEIQRMTAGTGVTHSEFNHSRQEPVHFLQVWILPEAEGLMPGYEQKPIPARNGSALTLIGDRAGSEGAITIHQDVKLYAGRFDAGEAETIDLDPARHYWLHLAKGTLMLAGDELRAGDGAKISGESRLELASEHGAEALLFDLA